MEFPRLFSLLPSAFLPRSSAAKLFCLFLTVFPLAAPAAEPFLQPHDVIALVGGEDMVAASEYGYLELLLTRALPDYGLKFRSLAWEGDTVFEQRRDLNYPTLEQQLDQSGATVVLAQFGQMESLAEEEKLSEFTAAYEKLIGRLRRGGKRRVLLVVPPSGGAAASLANFDIGTHLPSPREDHPIFGFIDEVGELAQRLDLKVVKLSDAPLHGETYRDGYHLTSAGQIDAAMLVGNTLAPRLGGFDWVLGTGGNWIVRSDVQSLLAIIREKNRLWFHYTRPQNWAFLAGDRTNQPSSRDHRDSTKRWFPEELAQFLPLIEQKEKEIAELASKLAKEDAK